MRGRSLPTRRKRLTSNKIPLKTQKLMLIGLAIFGAIIISLQIYTLRNIIYANNYNTNDSNVDTIVTNNNDASLDKAIQLPETRIPRRIFIIDKERDLSSINSPRRENTYNTIRKYHNAWFHNSNDAGINSTDNSNIDTDHLTEEQLQIVTYLNDESCIQIINQTEPELVQFFERETTGQYKADICRVVALYNEGGYYFDTDMEVVKPILLQPHITFTSPFEAIGYGQKYKGIFNSFIASAPKHPILRHTFELMLMSYQGKYHFDPSTWMGTAALFQGYTKFVDGDDTLKKEWPIDMNIAETLMTGDNYPDFPRHTNGKGCCCDYVVHNFTAKEIYFYSRIVGASGFCEAT